MSETDIKMRIESLELRLMHQDAALDELTRTLLSQEQLVSKLTESIRRLEEQLKCLNPTNPGIATDEPPPPHY